MTIDTGEILAKINSPEDLKKLKQEELPQLCEEVRQFIIDVISCRPGHFGASLGVVELTAALHYVFNTPTDKLIWDVGHQAYAHKILTGRKDVFHTNRIYKGISGFPKISESEFDAFGVGHSSTSVSAALGMAVASRLKKEKKRQHVAIIGDGAITGGMAFEGFNQAGVINSNVLVILNDNGIAIDENVGALKEYLTDVTTSYTYNKLKQTTWDLLGEKYTVGRKVRSLFSRWLNATKVALLFKKSNYFESMNFRYFGPVDGHDVERLVRIMNDLKKIQGPKLLHVITTKGKGFQRAEKEKTMFHAPGVFDKTTGEIIETPEETKLPPKYQDVFGETIIELAKSNPDIVAITPAMATGCSLNKMMEVMPSRVFDVGIAEQHAVTFSAGLAAKGMMPFCNIYSTFMQRAYDQVIHDVALQKLNVVMCLDRSGLVGEDGATHHGAYDLAFMRCVPDITIAAPMNEIELRNMMYSAQQKDMGPYVIRYPRGRGVISDWKKPFESIETGKARMIREGENIAIISIGNIGNYAVEACSLLEKEGHSISHCDLRFLKPIDEEMLHQIFTKHNKIITLENGAIKGGMGSAIIEFMTDNKYKADIVRMGIPDRFVEHGSISELQKECKYSVEDIVSNVREML